VNIRNRSRLGDVARLAAAVLAPLFALLWAGSATAETACLNDDDRKLCVDITSVPSEEVQPSELGGTDTFVKYTSVLRISGNKSSRFVEMRMELDRSNFVSVETPADVQCALAGGTITCFADKLEPGKPATITSTARAPETEGPFTNKTTVGWNGRTASANRTVLVSSTAGESHVPAGKSVTLVTGPDSDPDNTVTPENPIWGKFTIPAQDQQFHAQIAVTTSAGKLNCTGGLFLQDGGPYVCRQTGDRWIEVHLDTVPDGTLLQFDMKWDASAVPAAQLPPVPTIAPTGTPRFAVFYAHNPTPPPAIANAHAFSNMCPSPVAAPCLTGVARSASSGDWSASGYLEVDSTVTASAEPLAPLYAVLNYLLNPATAVGIKPPLVAM
jgi:hypothetical protein